MVVSQYGLDYESRVWPQLWRENLSNVREAENLADQLQCLAGKMTRNIMEQLEELNASGAFADHKVFVLTNNSAFEGSYYKGHLTSKELSDIVFCLFKA